MKLQTWSESQLPGSGLSHSKRGKGKDTDKEPDTQTVRHVEEDKDVPKRCSRVTRAERLTACASAAGACGASRAAPAGEYTARLVTRLRPGQQQARVRHPAHGNPSRLFSMSRRVRSSASVPTPRHWRSASVTWVVSMVYKTTRPVPRGIRSVCVPYHCGRLRDI